MYVHTYIFIWQRFVMPPRPSILAANFVFYKKKCQAKHKSFFVGTTEEVSETKGTPVETITTWKFTTVALLSHFHEKPKTFIYMCVCLYVLLYAVGSVHSCHGCRFQVSRSVFHVCALFTIQSHVCRINNSLMTKRSWEFELRRSLIFPKPFMGRVEIYVYLHKEACEELDFIRKGRYNT